MPSGSYDIGLAIQDRTFNADGSFFYPDPVAGDFIKDGYQGDTILVNGAVQPFFQVGTRKYRFRILNGANASVYALALQVSGSRSGPAFTQIGGDGGCWSGTVHPMHMHDVMFQVLDRDQKRAGS